MFGRLSLRLQLYRGRFPQTGLMGERACSGVLRTLMRYGRGIVSYIDRLYRVSYGVGKAGVRSYLWTGEAAGLILGGAGEAVT